MVQTPSQFARNTLDRICDLANKIIERLSGGHASARDIAMAEKIANYTQQLTLSAPGAYSRLLAQHRFTILTQCEPANFNADLLRNALDAYAIHSGWDEASPQDIVEHFIESAGHLTPNDIANLRAAKPRLTEAAQPLRHIQVVAVRIWPRPKETHTDCRRDLTKQHAPTAPDRPRNRHGLNHQRLKKRRESKEP